MSATPSLRERREHQCGGWRVEYPVVAEMPMCPRLSPPPFWPGELEALRPDPADVPVTGELVGGECD